MRSGGRERERERERESEREREREREEKFILKWALPNGSARRTLESASWFGRVVRFWLVARESRRDREERREYVKKKEGR